MGFPSNHIFNTWLNDTNLPYTVSLSRGKLLKDVDKKILEYKTSPNAENFVALKNAYFLWQISKEEKYYDSQGWKSSHRNREDKNYPVERLHTALFGIQNDDNDFSLILAREAKRDCVRTLYGCKAKFLYKDDVKEIFKQAKKDIQKDKQEKNEKDREIQSKRNEEQRQSSSKIERITQSLAGPIKMGSVSSARVEQGFEWIKDIAQTILDYLKQLSRDFMQFIKACWRHIRDLLLSLIAEICIALVPAINSLVNLGKSVKGYTDSIKMAAKACYKRYKDQNTIRITSKTYQLKTAIETFINETFKNALKEAGQKFAKALADTAGTVTGMTVPGNVSDIIKLTSFYVIKIANMAMEFFYYRKLNKELALINPHNPYLRDELLKEPLIAAYLITNATDATLFATVRDHGDMSTWVNFCQDNLSIVEKLKKRAEKYIESRKVRLTNLKESASDVVQAPFLLEVQQFEHHKLKKVETSSSYQGNPLLAAIRDFDKGDLKVTILQKAYRGDPLLKDIRVFDKNNLKVTIQQKAYRGDPLLQEIKGFDKNSLAQVTPQSVYQGNPLLKQIKGFMPSDLSNQQTTSFDYVKAMKSLEMQLRSQDSRILSKTMLGNNSLKGNLNKLETSVISNGQWKKLTWVKFGRRHEITQAIDKGLLQYQKFCQNKLTKMAAPANIKQLGQYLDYIAQRLEILQRDVLHPTKQWLDQLDRKHRTSPRKPAMNRLNAAAQSERNALQSIAMAYNKLAKEQNVLVGS